MTHRGPFQPLTFCDSVGSLTCAGSRCAGAGAAGGLAWPLWNRQLPGGAWFVGCVGEIATVHPQRLCAQICTWAEPTWASAGESAVPWDGGARWRAGLLCLAFVPANMSVGILFIWVLHWFLSMQRRKLPLRYLRAVERDTARNSWLQRAI